TDEKREGDVAALLRRDISGKGFFDDSAAGEVVVAAVGPRLRKNLSARRRMRLNACQRSVDAHDRQAVEEIRIPRLRPRPGEIMHHEIGRVESASETVVLRRSLQVEPGV